jgi:MFS family permease
MIFTSLREPAFRLFYIHNTFAAIDLGVRLAVHGWLVLALSNDSEVWVGIFALVLGIGRFSSSMVAGAIVDRFPRKSVLLAETAVGAFLAWGLGVAILFDAVNLPLAIVLAFVTGCQGAVRFTAANRYIYDLVGARQLVNGSALWRVSATPMMVFGALAAGGLIEWVGIWAAYGFMGTSLLVSLPFLVKIPVKGEVKPSYVNLLQQTVEGIRYAGQNRTLRTLFTVSIVMESLGFAFLIAIPLMAKTVLSAGGLGLGFLHAGAGIGTLLANLIMAMKGDAYNKPRMIILNSVFAGIALAGFALSRHLPLSILLASAVMASLNAYDLSIGALMQLVAPPELRGRAVSLHSLAISFTAFGGFAIGIAGSVVGVPTVLFASAGGIIINILIRRKALLAINEKQRNENTDPTVTSTN